MTAREESCMIDPMNYLNNQILVGSVAEMLQTIEACAEETFNDICNVSCFLVRYATQEEKDKAKRFICLIPNEEGIRIKEKIFKIHPWLKELQTDENDGIFEIVSEYYQGVSEWKLDDYFWINAEIICENKTMINDVLQSFVEHIKYLSE